MAGAASSVYEEDFNRLIRGLRAGTGAIPFPLPSSPSTEPGHRDVEEDFDNSSELDTPQFAPTAAAATEEERSSKESSSPLPIPIRTLSGSSGSIARSPPSSSLLAVASSKPMASSFVPPKPVSPIYFTDEEEVVVPSSRKPPTLRFHEAEDAGDVDYVNAWERKISKAMEEANTNPPTVRQELDQLRKVFSPMDTVLFKVLQEAPSSSSSSFYLPSLPALVCLAIVLVAVVVKVYL